MSYSIFSNLHIKPWLSACALSVLLGLSATSCSDNNVLTNVPTDDNEEENTEVIEQTPFTIIDKQGKPVDVFSADFNEYYIQVNVPGKWRLSTDNDYLVPLQKEGEGPTLVSLFVGINWYQSRSGNITLQQLDADATTRSTGSDVYTRATTQAETPDMSETMKMISSNKGAGYSYLPNSNYCLGTNMQIFNMSRLDSLQQAMRYDLFVDEYYPQVEEEVTMANSQEELSDKLSVAASVNVNFSAFSVDVKGHFGSSSSSSTEKEYAVKRLKSYQYTREINYMNLIALIKQKPELAEEIYAPGFQMKVTEFEAAIKEATSEEQKKKLCKDFCDEVGPCFISKAVMGCVLDYYISVNKSVLGDTMTAGGALDLQYSVTVKIEGSGDYTETEQKILENIEAKITVKGGDVTMVSILPTGGQLEGKAVEQWLLSVAPTTAVLIDMKLVPIYVLIDDTAAHDALKDYIDTTGSLDNDEKQ
ncbi:MAC/perforin domain-containing protein [uncultured Bacteroides sp.]|uniref:MAC/perforin domain-containing protein n=1 Tax=uncultured Bacteroides sp. TaxID=162156 RepID=UPI0026020031|nr:MAC/perforin domain-containing protein [uncultured Bacteroides sp.]